MPGVSTSVIPRSRNGCGRRTSTDSTPAVVRVAALGTQAARSSGAIVSATATPSFAPMDDRGRRVAVANDRHRHRREVVVDRADVGAEQAVDQRALALLELADDADRPCRSARSARTRSSRAARSPVVPPRRVAAAAAPAIAGGPSSGAGPADRGLGGRAVPAARGSLRQRAECTLRGRSGVARGRLESGPPRSAGGRDGLLARDRSRHDLLGGRDGARGIGSRSSSSASGRRPSRRSSSCAPTARSSIGEAAERRALARADADGSRVQAPARRPDADHPRRDALRRRGAHRATSCGASWPRSASSSADRRRRSRSAIPRATARTRSTCSGRPSARRTSATSSC